MTERSAGPGWQPGSPGDGEKPSTCRHVFVPHGVGRFAANKTNSSGSRAHVFQPNSHELNAGNIHETENPPPPTLPINLMAVSEEDSHLVQTAQVIIPSTQNNNLCAHTEGLNETINGTEHSNGIFRIQGALYLTPLEEFSFGLWTIHLQG